MSEREVKQKVDSREFTRWKAAYRVQPWGDSWAQADLIAWLIHAVNRSPGSESLPAGHFIPRHFPSGLSYVPPPMPTPQEVAEKMQAWAKSAGILVTPEGVPCGV